MNIDMSSIDVPQSVHNYSGYDIFLHFGEKLKEKLVFIK